MDFKIDQFFLIEIAIMAVMLSGSLGLSIAGGNAINSGDLDWAILEFYASSMLMIIATFWIALRRIALMSFRIKVIRGQMP